MENDDDDDDDQMHFYDLRKYKTEVKLFYWIKIENVDIYLHMYVFLKY